MCFDLRKHFKLSQQVLKDALRKMDRCYKIALIAGKLNLKKLNNHYAEKGQSIGAAALRLCNANLDLLQFGFDHDLYKKDV